MAGQTASCGVTVRPLEGYGTLDLTVLWHAGDTVNPSIDSELIPSTGASKTLDFTITGGDTGTYCNHCIETGYHTLVLKLLDGDVLTMGAVEVVQIVKCQTTSGTFEFYEINKADGGIDVNITPEMGEPLEVSL